jgi:hypothetical protein
MCVRTQYPDGSLPPGFERFEMKIRSWMLATGVCLAATMTLAIAPIDLEGRAHAQAPRSTSFETKGATIDEAKLQHHEPVACVGSQVIELTGVVIRTDAVAIATAGGCEVRIKDSHIVAPIAVQTAGGTVTVENTIIDAGKIAFQMAGDSTVSIKSSTVLGGVQRAAGSFKDLGSNIFR